ncbi:hypothetical protein HDU87_001607 [Geranomyces variabilis]|uniref:Tubby C-terminal domain-containing protein n=1 Tax=Geranomyces variabilis TaxID=109894 RepID=A0AAD5TP43_9FUNG|nr:hypothetical protein HDU87_001607 [Geranomyces variabilis]
MLRLDSEVNLSEAAVGALEAIQRPLPQRPPAEVANVARTGSFARPPPLTTSPQTLSAGAGPSSGRPADLAIDDEAELSDVVGSQSTPAAPNPTLVRADGAGSYGLPLQGTTTILDRTLQGQWAEQPAADQRIEADFDHTFEHHGAPASTPTNVRSPSVHELDSFVLKPIPMGQKLLCRIVRRKDGVEKLYPRYELYIEDPDNSHVFLLSARKKKKSSSSYYVITTTRLTGRDDSDGMVAKVRSNFVGTAFTIYGGRNEDATPGTPQSSPRLGRNKRMREELGMVLYDPNLLGFKGPRKMTVVLPSMTRDGNRVPLNPIDDKDSLSGRLRNGNDREILKLHNKAPQWNDETQSFVLNFNGRVTLASVKNFQIVHDNDLDYIILQFGRVSDDTFTVDFQYPMSCVQAFAIALTSFDAKLLCE